MEAITRWFAVIPQKTATVCDNNVQRFSSQVKENTLPSIEMATIINA
jgi:peroxiredoxin